MKVATLLSVTALASCTSVGEELRPLDTTTTTGVDAGQTQVEDAGAGGGGAGGADPGDAGAPKRTVMQRNPFGNVAEAENLLWDGDFEWYSPFSDQYGWLAGSSGSGIGFGFSDVLMGASCRSGIKCAGLAKNRVIAGIGVASQGGKILASFWARVGLGQCGDVTGTIISFDGNDDPDVMVKPTSADPDKDRWCHYETVVEPRKGKPVLFIKNDGTSSVVIDDAVIKRVPATTSLKAHHGPPSAELAAEIDGARGALRRLRGPHDAPPNAARRAFEARRGTSR